LYRNDEENPSISAVFAIVWPCASRNSICSLVTLMAGRPVLPTKRKSQLGLSVEAALECLLIVI
jgi:hypothetical protein